MGESSQRAPGDVLSAEAVWLLAVSIALIPLAWVPPMPFAGAQICDALGASGVVLAVVALRTNARDLAPIQWRAPAIAVCAYVTWGLVSLLVTHGNKIRLLGTWWLVALAAGVAAYATHSDANATRIRRALVAAALIGALTGLTGALLYALGHSTALLNHAGDLVPGNYPRIRGTMMRANALAGVLAVGLLLLGDVPRRWRLPIGAVLIVALVFTFSRSWIALAGGTAVYVLALGERRSRSRDLAAIGAIALCVGSMLVVSWLNVRLDPTRPWAVQIAPEAGTRWIHLQDALDTVAAHPLAGVGPGRMAALGWDAHFTLAQVAAIMGIPAALAFVAIVVLALKRAIYAARSGNQTARGVAAALVLCSIDALARDIEDQRVFWVLLGLAFVMRTNSPSSAAAAA